MRHNQRSDSTWLTRAASSPCSQLEHPAGAMHQTQSVNDVEVPGMRTGPSSSCCLCASWTTPQLGNCSCLQVSGPCPQLLDGAACTAGMPFMAAALAVFMRLSKNQCNHSSDPTAAALVQGLHQLFCSSDLDAYGTAPETEGRLSLFCQICISRLHRRSALQS